MSFRFYLFLLSFILIFFNFSIPVQSFSSGVVISEIAWMGTKASFRDEWIELYNNSDLSVDLTGWILKTSDEGLNIKLQGFIPVKSFYLIERNDDEVVKDVKADLIAGFGKGLSNDGEKLELYDEYEQLVDFIDASDGWPQGKASPDYKTMERIDLRVGGDLNNWKTNDGLNINGIDAEDNLIQGTPFNSGLNMNVGTGDAGNALTNFGVFINEILPNPKGSDKEAEYIELFNTNDYPVDLNKWVLEDEGKTQYKIKVKDFDSTIILANGYFVIYRKVSNIALNNSKGDALKLSDPSGELIDSMSYDDNAKEERSLNRDKDNWLWSETLTPGTVNVVELPNQPPAANFSFVADGLKVNFDASDSLDPENDPLVYSWDFGDGETGNGEIAAHTYKRTGKYKVVVNVSDGVNQTKDSKTIALDKIKELAVYSDQVVINEFLPNPVGSDLANEWIELYNKGNEAVDLGGWIISDSGKKSGYVIPEGTNIERGSFLVFKRADTKIAINNNGDGLNLFQPNDNLLDFASFKEKAKEGLSYNRQSDNTWAWSVKPTPGENNIIENQPKDTVAAKENRQKLISSEKLVKTGVILSDKNTKAAGNSAPKDNDTSRENEQEKNNSSPLKIVDKMKLDNQPRNQNMPLDASISSLLNSKSSMFILVIITLSGFVGSIGGTVFGKKLKIKS